MVETGSETEIGICVNIEPVAALPPPHPVKNSADVAKLIRQIGIVARSTGRMITPW